MLSISKTLEMRWFHQGRIPANVYQWFINQNSTQMQSPPEHRLDRYFYLPASNHLSLKIRQGNLECKWRDRCLGYHEFPALSSKHEYCGLLEKWQKWSLDGDYLPDISAILPNTLLINVEKTRWLYYDENIQFELCQLCRTHNQWWTFAIEIKQDMSNVTPLILQTIQKFLQTYPDDNLSLQKSYAYPQWFQENLVN